MLGTVPVWSVVLAIIFLNEHWSASVVVGTLLAVVGSILLATEGITKASVSRLGLVLASLTALQFAIRDVLARSVTQESNLDSSAAAAVTLGVGAVVLIGVALIGELQEKWESKYQVQSTQKLKQAEDWAVNTIVKWSDISEEEARKNVRTYVTEDLTQQLSNIKVEDIVDLGTNVVGRVTAFLGATFIVVLCTVFMLMEARMFGRRLSLIGEARGPNFERMLFAGKDIQRFLGIKTIVSLATGFLAGFLCWAAGLDFFILWGILAWALNYIPVMGSIVASWGDSV
jgi:AI-2 transport protein TqsA